MSALPLPRLSATLALVPVLVLALACQGSSLEVLSAEGSCSPLPEIDPCTSIPEFQGTQGVHARAQPYELCQLAPMTFAADRGAWKLHPDASFPERVTLRVGWSSLGLHLYARVLDPHVVVSPNDDLLEEGDSIEIYSASSTELEGPIDGSASGGAQRIVIAPPLGNLNTRALLQYQPRPGVVRLEDVFEASASYAATLVPDGYVVEALVRWSGEIVPEPGSAVAFNFALNIADTDTAIGREQQSALGYRLPGDTDCPLDADHAGPRPSCDSRTWCTPTLE
jgi:hypothetical protein